MIKAVPVSLHNSCHGCRANETSSNNEVLCEWGYRRREQHGTWKPSEPCPKPITEVDEKELAEFFRGVCDCGKTAAWIYLPGRANENPYACDECVPRGCSCNKALKDGVEEIYDANGWPANPDEDYEQPLDEKGRLYPCCEWDEV